ncbi:P-loop containing nucleoside triphosphate hydrolase protein [Melampsora americana]|nr:P-loop containing nucleoside triphosphate hydrolase protein [Melampsora americana]
MPDSDSLSSSTDNNSVVKVVCRLRPTLPHEPESSQEVVQVLNRREIRITDPIKKLINRFDFSACYDERSTQQEIFDNEVRDMVLGVFSGITASIFTYASNSSFGHLILTLFLRLFRFGCTGSGKTHTLQGSPTDPGITPRAIRAIFQHMSELKLQQGASAQYIVTMSCFEIWKDKVWDLLNEAGTSNTRDLGKGDLHIREATNGQVFVSNLRKIPLYTIHDFERFYEKAMRSRSTSSTKLNHASSRSHAILNLNLTQLRGGRTYEGKCVLIDLAGSENNKKTGNDENRERMKESVEINQSLLALRKVVRSLNAGESRIPYRDSKLTRILSDSLGGRSSALVICNIAPSPYQYRDTMNTLNFGSLTRNVENKVQVRDKETVKHTLAPAPFYQNSFLNKSAPQLPSESTIKYSSSDGCAVPYSYKPKLGPRPSLAALNGSQPKTSTPTSYNMIPSSSVPSIPELPSQWRTSPLLPRLETRPLIIKKKSSSLSPRSPHFEELQIALGITDPLNSGDSPMSNKALEERINDALRKNMNNLVEKRLDALLNAKLKETGLLDLQSPQTPRSQSSNTSEITTTDRDTDLVDRISNLEDQFQREDQRIIEHCAYPTTTFEHQNSFTKSTFKVRFAF